MKHWLWAVISSAALFFGSHASAQFGIRLEAYGSISDTLSYRAGLQPIFIGSPGVVIEARLEAASELSFGGPLYFALIGSPFAIGAYQPGAAPSFAFVGLEGIARMGFRSVDFHLNFNLAFAPGLLFKDGAVNFTLQYRAGIDFGNEFFQVDFDVGKAFDLIFLRVSASYAVTPWLRIGIGYWVHSGIGGGGG